MLYAGGLSFPSSSSSRIIPPYYTSTLSNTPISVGLTLQATQNYYITYAGYITYYFGAFMSASVAYTRDYVSSGLVSINSISNHKLSSESAFVSLKAYLPGDIISIRFEYSGFVPREEVYLFYAIRKSGIENPIMQRNITTSSTGAGVFDTTWTIPWDQSLAGEGPDNTQIIVRGSNVLLDIYKSPTFETILFTETDGIFTAPSISEIVPTDTPYKLRWDAKLLAYFEPILYGSYIGSEVPVANVTFEVVGEKMSANGTVVLSSLTYRNLILKPVPNSGECIVSFPSNLTDSGDRFYIIIRSVENGQSSGWSKNYFQLKSSNINLFAINNVALFKSKSKTANKQEILNVPTETSRLLDGTGCALTQGGIAYSASTGVFSKSLSIYLIGSIDVSGYKLTLPLIDTQHICVSPSPPGTLRGASVSPTPQPTLFSSPYPTYTPYPTSTGAVVILVEETFTGISYLTGILHC